jgi:hypothetical protein
MLQAAFAAELTASGKPAAAGALSESYSILGPDSLKGAQILMVVQRSQQAGSVRISLPTWCRV